MVRPLISVIVPVYNAEEYLEQCLDSIQKQTYTRIEVLIVDDGSTDRSPEICDQYVSKDSRFKVWHTQNLGSFAARNLALAHVHTPYVGFVDADDWIEPEMYATLYKELRASESDIVQCKVINEGKRAQMKSKVGKQSVTYVGDMIYEGVYGEVITHSVNDKLFCFAPFSMISFHEGYYHADAMMIVQLPKYCRKITCIEKKLYHYRTSNQSITRGNKNPMHLRSMEKLFSFYDDMSYKAQGTADYYICSEIPSLGRLIVPNKTISLRACLSHVQLMHKIFCKHWIRAKETIEFSQASFMKKMYWRFYYMNPYMASAAMYVRFLLHTLKY